MSNNSKLYRATFKEVSQVHFNDFNGIKLEKFITQIKPDIIIYQVVERYWISEVKF